MKKKIAFTLTCRVLIAFCLVGLAGLNGVSAAAEDRNQKWPHETSDLAPAPEVVFGSLENGFRYVLMQNKRPEDRVSMHLDIDAGAFHETDNQRGVAHFLEHMLFTGTTHFPPGELVKYFQRIGMQFGPDVNGRTGFYNTTYDLDLPHGDKETLAEGLLVMRDYAAEALLPEEEVTKERSVILAEKRTRDSPDYRTFEATLEFEAPDARISDRLPIGVESVIRNTDRALLKGFYDTWYRPDKMTLIMVGDFDTDIARELIQKRFADLSAKAPRKPVPDFGSIRHQGIKPFYHYESESGGTTVSIEVLSEAQTPPDSVEYQRRQLLSDMANRIIQHRLNEILNQADAPFTDAGIHSGYYLRHIKAAEISADCAPTNWEASLARIEQTLRKALEHGFTTSEVIRVQKEYTAQLEKAVRSASTRESGHIAGQIIHHLNNERVFQSPKQRQDLLQSAVDAATPESLHAILKTDWAPDHRLVLVTGNADLNEKETSPEKRIATEYRRSLEVAVEKPENRESIHFPYLAAPATRSAIKAKEILEDADVTRVVFANGVTLLAKKTDFKANQVLAALSFGHGEAAEPRSNPALSEMAQKVVNLSGLGKLDREALRQALAGKNTGVGFHVEEDKFVFSGSSVTDEIQLLFELLYAHLRDPGFRKSAHALAIDQFQQQYESLNHSVQGAISLEGRRFLSGGDPRFGLPSLEVLEQTDLEAIRKWLDPAFDAAPLEIAVVGDFDMDQVISAASTFFGSLPDRSPEGTPRSLGAPDFPEGENLDISVPTRIQKGLLMVAYPTADIWDIHRTRRLSVLSEVFSDRMRIRIREKLGASYSQAAYNDPSRAYPGFGIFNTYVVIDPGDAGVVEAAIRDIAEGLHEKGATEDELKRALEPTLTGIKEQLKTNSYWLNTVLKGAARHPEQIEWSRTILSDYADITVEDVNKMAKTYLVNTRAAAIRVSPEKTEEAASHPQGAAIQ